MFACQGGTVVARTLGFVLVRGVLGLVGRGRAQANQGEDLPDDHESQGPHHHRLILVGPWPRLVRAVTLKLHPSGALRGVRSGYAAVFVDQPAEYVDPFDALRRYWVPIG